MYNKYKLLPLSIPSLSFQAYMNCTDDEGINLLKDIPVNKKYLLQCFSNKTSKNKIIYKLKFNIL